MSTTKRLQCQDHLQAWTPAIVTRSRIRIIGDSERSTRGRLIVPLPRPRLLPLLPAMAPSRIFCLSLFLFLAVFDTHLLTVAAQLQYNYYAKTCPQAYDIIKSETYRYYKIHGNYATSAYRNIFHDCAVDKCDASILLDGTPGVPNERASLKNFGLRNFKYFHSLKATLEKACPGIVSCADLVALTGVYSVEILGDIYVEIKTGRLDGSVTLKEHADSQLISKDASTAEVLSRFKQLGINTEQAVALLGAHSVGRAHCQNLNSRLYPTVSPDYFLPGLGAFLLKRCPKEQPAKPTDPFYARFDEITPMGLDNNYFKNLISGRGLLHVDSQLYSDPITKPYVIKFAGDNEYFKKVFGAAIKILLEFNAFTGPGGKVHKNCRTGI